MQNAEIYSQAVYERAHSGSAFPPSVFQHLIIRLRLLCTRGGFVISTPSFVEMFDLSAFRSRPLNLTAKMMATFALLQSARGIGGFLQWRNQTHLKIGSAVKNGRLY